MTQALSVDEEYALARRLAKNFGDLIGLLKSRARKQGISREQIAMHLEWTIEDVIEVESLGGNPTLSMIQDYARATGADVTFDVRQYVPSEGAIATAKFNVRVQSSRPAEWTSADTVGALVSVGA
ncbi:hypothetical protein B2J88_35760 [Rhodococcus sp. SRB_17]|nr:hypothetical protein [Rhodococcus sp. SRB_17]